MTAAHSHPVWYDLDPPPTPTSSALPTAPVDVVVVGAGIAGLCCGVELARTGASVIVLDRAAPGSGATGRNAGFLLAESDCLALAADAHGDRVAGQLRTIGTVSRTWLAALDPPPRHLERVGSLRLAQDAGEADAFVDSVATLDPALELPEQLPPEAGPSDSPIRERWIAGLLDRADAASHPLHVVSALLEELKRLAVPVVFPVEVTELRRSAAGWELVHDGADAILAERVVLAAGASRIAPTQGRGRPVRAQALAATCDPVPTWRHCVYATRGGDYWRLLPNGQVLVGGRRRISLATEETAEPATEPSIQASLDELLRELVGPTTRVRVTHRWSGTMVFSPDGLPVVGPDPSREGIFHLGGFTGHGMGWAPALAALLARSITQGVATVPAAFDPARLRPQD